MSTKFPFPTFSHSVKRGAALAMIGMMAFNQAQAAFHLWNINEIYSDGSGSLQFIEFFTSQSSQQFVGGQQVSVSNVGNTQTHTFTIPSNLPGDTFNHSFLLGTAGIQAAGAPAPDYIIPNNFLFTAGGTISFFGANGGAYSAMPTDGSLSRNWGDGNAVNSPRDFAGQAGTIVVPEPAIWGLLAAAVTASFLRLRGRIA